MKYGIIAALAFASALAWGRVKSCDLSLGDGLRATVAAQVDRDQYDISDVRFHEIARAAAEYCLKTKKCNSQPIVIFRQRWQSDFKIDVGYKIQMQVDDRSGDLMLNGVEPLSQDDERAYFLKMANEEQLQTMNLQLPYAVFGRRVVRLSPSIQIKLREKHFLTSAEVREAFLNRVTTLQNERHRGHNRFSFIGRTAGGKRLRVAVALDAGSDTFNLVSAYLQRH